MQLIVKWRAAFQTYKLWVLILSNKVLSEQINIAEKDKRKNKQQVGALNFQSSAHSKNSS